MDGSWVWVWWVGNWLSIQILKGSLGGVERCMGRGIRGLGGLLGRGPRCGFDFVVKLFWEKKVDVKLCR